MVEWHHQTNGHEFEQTLGDSEGLGSLACCNPCSQKDSDTTEQKMESFSSFRRFRRDINFKWLMAFIEFVTTPSNYNRYILSLKYLIISCCPLPTLPSTHCSFSQLKCKNSVFCSSGGIITLSLVRGFHF